MYCQNKIVYTVQAGDSLYKLSRQYKTTVTELILGNPGVNPYNLQVGMKLAICPGRDYQEPGQQNPGQQNPGQQNPGQQTPGQQSPDGNRPENNMPEESEEQMENAVNRLQQEMRLAWINHVFWTRMYLMSVTADAPDQQAVEERLLETADEITDVFANYLPVSVTRELRNLLIGHIELAGEVIHALKSGEMQGYDNIIKEWYGNANKIASLLGGVNPYFAGRETRNMLLNYLDLLREEIEQQMNGEYGQSIDTFRDIENQVIAMADYFSRGLMAR